MAKQKLVAGRQGKDYIEHESIFIEPDPNKKEEPQNVEAEPEPSLEIVISRELKRFTLADAGIAALQAKYGTMSIDGLDDKDGYKAVKEAWGEVRTTRTALQKKGLEIRDDYNKIAKAISGEEKRLLELIKPLEEHLEITFKAIDDLKAAEKKRKEKEEEDKLQTRIRTLTEAGMVFEDGYYQIGGTISLDVASIRPMKDEQFDRILASVKAKAAELKEQREKTDREANQRQAELDEQKEQQRKQQEGLDRQRKDLEDQQRKLQEQKDEAAKAIIRNRTLELQAEGMKINGKGDGLVFDNGFGTVTITMDDIKAADDSAFRAILQRAGGDILRLHLGKKKLDEEKELERQALEAKRQLIHSIFADSGLVFDNNAGIFKFVNNEYMISYSMDRLLERPEEDLKILAANENEKIAKARGESIRKEQEKKLKEEEDRKQRLSDSQRLGEYMLQLRNVDLPILSSDKYSERLKKFTAKFNNLLAEFAPLQQEEVPFGK
jgi:multidrug efflux pump subunit AcrA (membrane-fusion protein)